MRRSTSAQLYINVSPDAADPPHRWALGPDGPVLELDARVERVRWGRSLAGSRRTGRWRPGRGGGALTVDLVPVTAGRALLSVRFDPPDQRLGRRVTPRQAWAVAERLREALEGRPIAHGAPVEADRVPRPRSEILPA